MSDQKIRVLLADDEGHIRLMLKTVLKTAGYEIVAEAANGQEAVDLFHATKPDLVLLDLNMPIKTGIEALQEITLSSPETCVIMLTSVSDMQTVQACLDSGAAHYVRKDTPIAEMKAIIAETCRSYWQSTTGE